MDMPSEKENPDFAGLPELNLPPTALEEVKNVRIKTREIRESINPNDINSWEGLVNILESALEIVKREKKMSKLFVKK